MAWGDAARDGRYANGRVQDAAGPDPPDRHVHGRRIPAIGGHQARPHQCLYLLSQFLAPAASAPRQHIDIPRDVSHIFHIPSLCQRVLIRAPTLQEAEIYFSFQR